MVAYTGKYKGRGEHSVNALEDIIERSQRELEHLKDLLSRFKMEGMKEQPKAEFQVMSEALKTTEIREFRTSDIKVGTSFRFITDSLFHGEPIRTITALDGDFIHSKWELHGKLISTSRMTRDLFIDLHVNIKMEFSTIEGNLSNNNQMETAILADDVEVEVIFIKEIEYNTQVFKKNIIVTLLTSDFNRLNTIHPKCCLIYNERTGVYLVDSSSLKTYFIKDKTYTIFADYDSTQYYIRAENFEYLVMPKVAFKLIEL